MMQAKKLLGLLLLGSFLLSDGLNAARFQKKARPTAEASQGGSENLGRGGNQGGQGGHGRQDHTPPPPPVSHDVVAPITNAAAAIQAALDCLNALTKNLEWNGNVIQTQAEWKAFIDGVAEAYREEMANRGPVVRTSKWVLGDDFKIKVVIK